MELLRVYRAGDALQDLCRACKTVRDHTVIVADPGGVPLRVICDYCQSQHNYRGGEAREKAPARAAEKGAAPQTFTVSERERSFPAMSPNASEGNPVDLELMLRRVIREEAGITAVPIADKWRGGDLILRPGRAELQEKIWPIETFFHKVVMLRNRLRVLEQQINGMDVPEDLKVKLQGYITGCYGTLTSFNVLFAEEDDRFHGAASE
jgi:hypothetical protein